MSPHDRPPPASISHALALDTVGERIVHEEAAGDRTARTWLLHLAPASGEPARVCLMAHSHDVMRRFWRVPEGWHELDDAVLLALINGPPDTPPDDAPRGESTR